MSEKVLFNPSTKVLRIVVAIIAVVSFVLAFKVGDIADANKEKAEAEAEAFKTEHYVEKEEKHSYGYYSWTETIEEWDSDENESKYYEMQDDILGDYWKTISLQSPLAAVATIFIAAYLGISGIFMTVFSKCKAYIAWLNTLYDDTAKKLIALIKALTKILCILALLASFIAFFCGINMWASGAEAWLVFVLSPIAAIVACLALQITTAISVMTINMIADVSSMKKKICDDEK